MAQVINTNIGALFAGAALNKSANALQTAQQRLSSGLRINSSKDDATGLGIAVGYDSQIRGTNIAVRNANDAISKLQTVDGYGAQITENLQRLHEIFIQTNNVSTTESNALIAENARISNLTSAAGALPGATVTVDGSGGTRATASAAIIAPVGGTVLAAAAVALTGVNTTLGSTAVTAASTTGLYVGQPITGTGIPAGATVASITSGTAFTLSAAATSTNAASTATGAAVTAGQAGVPVTGAATATITDIATVTASRATYGSEMTALGSAVSTMQTASVNFSASYSRIMDTDYAAETANMTRNNILQQAGTAVLAQANQTPNSVMSLLR
jgi:flagellin